MPVCVTWHCCTWAFCSRAAHRAESTAHMPHSTPWHTQAHRQDLGAGASQCERWPEESRVESLQLDIPGPLCTLVPLHRLPPHEPQCSHGQQAQQRHSCSMPARHLGCMLRGCVLLMLTRPELPQGALGAMSLLPLLHQRGLGHSCCYCCFIQDGACCCGPTPADAAAAAGQSDVLEVLQHALQLLPCPLLLLLEGGC